MITREAYKRPEEIAIYKVTDMRTYAQSLPVGGRNCIVSCASGNVWVDFNGSQSSMVAGDGYKIAVGEQLYLTLDVLWHVTDGTGGVLQVIIFKD